MEGDLKNFIDIGKGVYLWTYSTFGSFENMSSRIGEVITNCKNSSIGLVLFSLKKCDLENKDLARSIVECLHKDGILAGAMFSQKADLKSERSCQEIRNFLQNVLDYNSGTTSAGVFDLVHFDLEPHSCELLKQTKRKDKNEYWKLLEDQYKILTGIYLELKSKLKDYSSAKLYIGADFPYWSEFAEDFIDALDYTCVMAYGNTVEKCYEYSKDHVKYAQEKTKPIFVSLNYNDNLEDEGNDQSTFYSKGNDEFNYAIKKISRSFSGSISFSGVMIHDYKSYFIYEE
jgi:hypothetical protein